MVIDELRARSIPVDSTVLLFAGPIKTNPKAQPAIVLFHPMNDPTT